MKAHGRRRTAFVRIDAPERGQRASVAVNDLSILGPLPEERLREAAAIYSRHLSTMRDVLRGLRKDRESRRPVRARVVWRIGDMIFSLRDDLAAISVELDGLYSHLVRDLQVKQKWLEKVVILRRYLASESMIPEHLSWGKCEKGTRRVATELLKAYMTDRESR